MRTKGPDEFKLCILNFPGGEEKLRVVRVLKSLGREQSKIKQNGFISHSFLLPFCLFLSINRYGWIHMRKIWQSYTNLRADDGTSRTELSC